MALPNPASVLHKVDLSPIGAGYAHVDEIKKLDPKSQTIATTHVYSPERILDLRDHFVGNNIAPGFHLLEAIVQSAIPLGRELVKSETGSFNFFLAGIEWVRFHRMVRPQEEVEISVRITRFSTEHLFGSAEFKATVNAEETLSGKFTFRLKRLNSRSPMD